MTGGTYFLADDGRRALLEKEFSDAINAIEEHQPEDIMRFLADIFTQRASESPLTNSENSATPRNSSRNSCSVRQLFNEWDIEGNGMIEIKALKGVTVNVGPQESQVLSQLIAMDYNGDGFVEASEWETYFGTTAGVLSDSEFQVIMDDLRASGEQMVTILRCTKLASGAGDAPKAVSSDEASEAAEALAAMTLSGERKAKVEELFKTWDVKGDGKIAYKTLNSTGVQVGPKEIKVLDDLGRMDTDGDEFVSLSEMLAFFGACSAEMNDEEFATIMGDMSDVAATTTGVAKMIAMTNDAAATAGVVGEGEEIEPPPEMSPEREALVKSLFEAFSESVNTPIAIKSLELDTKTSVGPAKESVLSNLVAMDANGDGMLEYGEMKDYFAVCGAVLSDDEFEMILGDMRDNATTAQMIKTAEALAR